VNPFAL